MIKNYDNVFVRMVTISLAKTLNKTVRWINRFEENPNSDIKGSKIRVVVPFYLSLVGDENFLLDAFVDDIKDQRVDLNTDQIPRGIITFKGGSPVSSEFANPNQYLSSENIINGEMRKILSKLKPVPVNLNYDIEIIVANELDANKCWEKIIDSLFNYKFFRFDYFGLNIDAFFTLPDDISIDILREESMDNDRFEKIRFSLIVKTYKPTFLINPDDLEVCDNDDEIDWERLNIPRPTLDYCNTVKKYRENLGEKNPNCSINRVFWKSYLYGLNKIGDEKPKNDKGDIDIKNIPPENF